MIARSMGAALLGVLAVRDDLKNQLPVLQSWSNADRVRDLAQYLKDIPAIADRSFVLSGARLIDGTGRPPVDEAVVVVRDGRKDSGTIEPGKRADLIVLNADPLADIKNIRKPRWVVANGRMMEPAGLWRAAGFK